MIKKEIIYFEKPGRSNTDECIEAVKRRIVEGDIKQLVVASGTGETALKFAGVCENVVCVSYHAGMKPEKKEALEENSSKLKEKEIKLVNSTHTLSAGERSIAKRWSGTYPLLIVADTYRTFCEGIKVCVEVSLMATDNGVIPAGENILVVAGTSKGCDTAVILRSAYSGDFMENLVINEVICMPMTEGNKHDAR
ncbi:MAG: pyruvate kinase alpha/beta domain-containing protein [Nanoarchaeota archaeon]|nr:pyruvate kinase alpha/beta domain-containing protein [Nanoarchaeota archaeon]